MLMVIRSVYRYWANLMGATTDSHGKTWICICRRLGVLFMLCLFPCSDDVWHGLNISVA